MAHNEDTRVKIPAILHLYRLGYKYISLKNAKWDIETNIFTDIFFDSVAKINSGIEKEDIQKVYDKVSLILDNEDLGKEFYALTPGRQRAYLLHFSDAKQSVTRIARIEKYTQHILDGKGMQDR